MDLLALLDPKDLLDPEDQWDYQARLVYLEQLESTD
jgi:hypothetical protein